MKTPILVSVAFLGSQRHGLRITHRLLSVTLTRTRPIVFFTAEIGRDTVSVR